MDMGTRWGKGVGMEFCIQRACCINESEKTKRKKKAHQHSVGRLSRLSLAKRASNKQTVLSKMRVTLVLPSPRSLQFANRNAHVDTQDLFFFSTNNRMVL